MKRLLNVVLFCTIFNFTYSQSISPVQTGEFCPNVEYTFTVSIPKSFQSIIGNAGCSVTSQPSAPVGSTFTFKGKFGDANQKQWFRVTYTDQTFSDFIFLKVKSLFFSTAATTSIPPCNVIRPNQIQPVVFPRCQVANATISFPNIQWFTNFENPELCFGTVTDYEYQLPAGWSIGVNTSTGSNWISGGNSVTVTSDLSTGDGADIRIRASNKTCGTGLAANGPQSFVRISRPEPSLSVASNKAILCDINELASFTINGLPSGATVVWSLPNANGNAVIDGCTTCPTINVKKLANYPGYIDVVATVSDCSTTYPAVTKQIALGNAITVERTQNGCNGSYQIWNMSANPASLGSNWNWTVGYVGNNSQITIYTPSSPGTIISVKGGGTVNLNFIDGCGIPQQYGITVYSSCYSAPFTVSVSPNPSKSFINISLASANNSRKVTSGTITNKTVLRVIESKNRTVMSLLDISTSRLVKQWVYNESTNENYNLNINGLRKGIYMLQVNRNNQATVTKVIIE